MREQSRFCPSVLPQPLLRCFVHPLYDSVLVFGLIFLDPGKLFSTIQGMQNSKFFTAVPTMVAPQGVTKLSDHCHIRLSKVGISVQKNIFQWEIGGWFYFQLWTFFHVLKHFLTLSCYGYMLQPGLGGLKMYEYSSAT